MIYGMTKLACEILLPRIAATQGIQFAAARLASVYGPWEYATGARDTLSPMLAALTHAQAGHEALLSHPGAGDFCYSRDIAAGLVALSETPTLTQTTYNLGSGTPTTAEDWCQALATHHPDFRWRRATAGRAAQHHQATSPSTAAAWTSPPSAAIPPSPPPSPCTPPPPTTSPGPRPDPSILVVVRVRRPPQQQPDRHPRHRELLPQRVHEIPHVILRHLLRPRPERDERRRPRLRLSHIPQLQPPPVHQRRLKLRYVTQAKARPPTFIAFGTRACCSGPNCSWHAGRSSGRR